MRSRMVRDPGNGFAEYVSFTRKPRVPQCSMGQTNRETPKTIQATMEPSSGLRGFLATLCPQNLQHLEKLKCYSSGHIALPKLSACPYQSSISFPGTKQNYCTSSMYQNWNEVGRLADYGITCSKLETFLTWQRPTLHFSFLNART